jgi:carbon-monoxide dehydrogenase medium subunit
VLGLNATIRTNKRTIAADDYFKGMYTTALQDGEIITAVSFPIPKCAAYIKFRNPASRFALVGVFVCQNASGVRVAVTGAGSSGVFRATAMEQALAKNFTANAVKNIKIDPANLSSDIHAGAPYRSHLIGVLTARAVAQAMA